MSCFRGCSRCSSSLYIVPVVIVKKLSVCLKSWFMRIAWGVVRLSYPNIVKQSPGFLRCSFGGSGGRVFLSASRSPVSLLSGVSSFSL